MARMEDEYAFYRRYGYQFPNAGRVFNKARMDRFFRARQKEREGRRLLHMKQFDKAYKVVDPPGAYWSQEDPYDKYDSLFDDNDNHPLDPPV
jgi:hypothetical protein